MALSDIWHTLAHRTGWIKSTAWLSVFFVLYAIALSSFYNIANNTAPEANFKQPKLKGKAFCLCSNHLATTNDFTF